MPLPISVDEVLVKNGTGDLMLAGLPSLYKKFDSQTAQAIVTIFNDVGESSEITAGQLERFLLLAGEESDDWFTDVYDLVQNTIDIDNCVVEALPFIATMLNADLSPFQNDRNWREHLKCQLSLLKTRGTIPGILNFIKFYTGWDGVIEPIIQTGYGVANFGTGDYGTPGSASNAQFKIKFDTGSGAQGDPKQAEKVISLNAILPSKYIPIGVTYTIDIV